MGCKGSKTRFSDPAPEDLRPAPNTAHPVEPQAAAAAASRAGQRHVDAARTDDSTQVPPASAVAPSSGKPKDKFRSVGPTVEGDVFPCFKDGLLFRIITASGSWFFYNDTNDYEMHVSFKFGTGSAIIAVPPATLQAGAGDDAGEVMVSVVVFPGETTPFIEGRYNGYKSNMAARPLSAEYRKRINAEANLKVQRELDVIRKLSRGSDDAQQVLRACVQQRVPFVDVAFPPLQSSLSRPNVDARVIPETAWKRSTDFLPKEDHSRISLFCGGVHPNDIDQGQLGDCWLLCSIAAVAEFPEKVIDMFCHPNALTDTRAADAEQRVGAYRITLNKHGWWHIIVVDDYLPVVGQRPCFAKCLEDPAELWVSLLEKAYAKLHGSYAAITGGDALQALQDLTGYPVCRFDEEWVAAMTDRSKADALFFRLLAYDQKHFLTNLNTPGFDSSSYMAGSNGNRGNVRSLEERYKKAGLGLGHAYTALRVCHFPEHNLRLLQIRNPWGNGVEWTGRWGDQDDSWRIYPDVARAVNFAAADDGTFWMSFDDALQYFDGGGVCFTQYDWFDYRARGAFKNGFPTLVLEVTVTQPVVAYAIVSQKDKRGLPASDPDSKYSALMLSVSRVPQGAPSNHQVLHLNSTANTEEPSEQFTFNYARDLGLQYTFVPESSPYYIIPRIYDAGGSKEYVLGLIADTPAGGADKRLSVTFKTLPKTCRVFHNFPEFVTDGAVLTETEYQVNPEVGAPRTLRGNAFRD